MIPTYTGELPYLTTEQMIEVDRAMKEDYSIGLIQMMENAGRNLAHLARKRFFDGDPRGKRVSIFKNVPARQLDILRRMGLPGPLAESISIAERPDLIVDGIIGYSLKGAPRGSTAELIRWANKREAPILALDAPSGVDTTTGTVFDPAIRATATMTLALPKVSLRAPGVKEQVGELYLADISVPPGLYAAPTLDLQVNHIFAQNDIVRLLI